jgi:hypothetical protein
LNCIKSKYALNKPIVICQKIDIDINAFIDPSETDIGIFVFNASSVNNNTVSKSTFGAMEDYSISTFGSTAGGFMIFFLLLLIVGGVFYYLHSKGKVKIPVLPQRIAAFGRQIKAIRKM